MPGIYKSQGKSWDEVISNYKDTRTKRTKEQQKLWQQSGTLHRLRMNLLVLSEDSSAMLTGMERLRILDAVEVLNRCILRNKEQFSTIKQRIRND